MTTFATAEDEGNDIPNPRHARAAAKALARSQRMARKTKGSKNRSKAKERVARAHAKVSDQRADFHHKQARRLIVAYDRIGIEDLRVTSGSVILLASSEPSMIGRFAWTV